MAKQKPKSIADDLFDSLLENDSDQSQKQTEVVEVQQPTAVISQPTQIIATPTQIIDNQATRVLTEVKEQPQDAEKTSMLKTSSVILSAEDVKNIAKSISNESTSLEPKFTKTSQKAEEIVDAIVRKVDAQVEARANTKHTEIKSGYGSPLMQSEGLRLAQERILSLEQEVEAFRVENEQLRASEQALFRKVEDLNRQVKEAETRLRESKVVYAEEISLVEGKAQAKENEISKLKLKVEELEIRLLGDVKRVRMRERELENRLELMKIETAAIVRSKDEMILQLKRTVDQSLSEIENYKNKGKTISKDLDSQYEKIRRTVRALRMTLSMLDGGGDEGSGSTGGSSSDGGESKAS